ITSGGPAIVSTTGSLLSRANIRIAPAVVNVRPNPRWVIAPPLTRVHRQPVRQRGTMTAARAYEPIARNGMLRRNRSIDAASIRHAIGFVRPRLEGCQRLATHEWNGDYRACVGRQFKLLADRSVLEADGV